MRVFQRKVLWLIRSEPATISKIHIAELKTKYQANALDLIELRAVVSALPPSFENDADGAKGAWKSNLVERLHELVAKEEKGEIQKRNAAYGGLEHGPFDPDASPLKISHHVSTPFGKNDMESIRKTCRDGGKFTANRDTIQKQKQEGSVVVPNKDRIDPDAIGSVIIGNEGFMDRLNSCIGGETLPSSTSNEKKDFTIEVNSATDKDSIKAKLEGLFGGGGGHVAAKPVKRVVMKVNSATDKDSIKAKLEGLFGGGGGHVAAKPVKWASTPKASPSTPSFLDEIKARKAKNAAQKDSTPKAPSFLDEIKANRAAKENFSCVTPKSKSAKKKALGDRTNSPTTHASTKQASSFLDELKKRRGLID